ncbi:MAG: hypothetical protein ABFC62_12770 [Clostridiaceae bacterium]|nr:hypothetical protein [Eubacteriales bacterium]
MDGISLNELSALLSASGTRGTASSSAASSGATAFYDLLGAQLNGGSLFGASDTEDGLFSSSSSAPLLGMTALYSALGDKSGGDGLGGALESFCMLLGSGVSGAGLVAAVSSLSSALKNAPEGAAESLRAALLSGGFSRSVLTQANDALFSSNTSDANYPYNASKAVTPLVTSDDKNRSASLYEKVVAQFKVESNPRYAVNKGGTGDTYCNIYLWDVTRAMGAEIPHYVDAATLEARDWPDVSGAKELNANGIYDWLSKKGGDYGWKQVSAASAQSLANDGHPVVTAWKNPSGHGHVQVVVPSEDGAYDEARGVAVAQAGRRLFSYGSIKSVYGESLDQVVYYAHA